MNLLLKLSTCFNTVCVHAHKSASHIKRKLHSLNSVPPRKVQPVLKTSYHMNVKGSQDSI